MAGTSGDSETRRELRPPLVLVALLLGAASASCFVALAAAPGEIDEAIFAGAVTRFDLLDLSPQAPGFPVWILLGKLFRPLFVAPYQTLAALSTLLAALMLPALYIWGRRLVGGWAALGGTLLAAALPVVWINGGRAFSDTPSTAFFLLALAALALDADRAERAEAAERAGGTSLVFALPIAAGLLAAAGAGVRPHLALVFGPLLLAEAFVLSGRNRRAALAFLLAGLAGTAGWGGWLLAEAGGLPGLRTSLAERAGFRAQAFATGTFGTFADSFLVRDFLSPARAAIFLLLALGGLAAVAFRRRRRALDLALVLVPGFLSLWFLHSRAMSRYSVPFVVVVSLLVAAGVEALVRFRPAGLALVLAGAGLVGRESWREIRETARATPPPMAAIASLENWVHPGRETIVADDAFAAFLRTERWEGRLVAWGYLESEFVAGPLQANRRYVRLADFTAEPPDPSREADGWRIWRHGGRVAEALGNRRLLVVGVRDPSPPIFGSGFGMKESPPGRPSFRWSGPTARLIVPGLEGPPAALLSGERPGDAGTTVLTIRDAVSGRLVETRTVPPGRFDLSIVDAPVYGPLDRPREYLLSCDRPVPLPETVGATRPREGCFVFRDAASSAPPTRLWERFGKEIRVDVGSSADGRADLDGFHDRESEPGGGADFRWTAGRATLVWVPLPGFTPSYLALRARAPGREAVEVTVTVGGMSAGTIRVAAGDFAEFRLPLAPDAAAALTGHVPVRIGLVSATFSPKRAGAGDDGRELGIAVDRVILR